MDPTAASNVVTVAATLDSYWDYFGPPPTNCTANPLTPILSTLGFNNMTFTNNTVASQMFHSLFYNTTANFMHAMLASVRLDFGNKCPNYLTDQSLINTTFLATPDLTPDQYSIYFQSDEYIPRSFNDIIRSDNVYLNDILGVKLPVYDIEDVYVTAPYLCHLTVRKGTVQLLASLAIAISSLSMSVWSIFQFLAPWFAQYQHMELPNYCKHPDLEKCSPKTPVRQSSWISLRHKKNLASRVLGGAGTEDSPQP
ncbi:hypothetical protein FRB97_002169 [Tulasnella sp. 331]|nr:hypothetical protein FRB97_002169 [Tulasnella sp. 331]